MSKEVKDCQIDEEAVLRQAKSIVEDRVVRGIFIHSAKEAKDMVILKLSNLGQEEFGCLFLDTRHRVIAFETMFYGTIDRSVVYPRVVAKHALDSHAAAVIFCHNHPSGDPNPSSADIALTERLKEALQLFDIRVLDHLIVGGTQTYSLAEHGLL